MALFKQGFDSLWVHNQMIIDYTLCKQIQFLILRLQDQY